MNNIAEMDGDQSNYLNLEEAASLLWEWRKYRNQAFWNSVYRLGAATVVLTIIPYLLPDLISKLGSAIFVFPVMAFLLSVFAAYLLIVQYMLYKLVDRKYRSLLGIYNPGDIPNTPITRVFRISIGKILAGLFLFFAVIGQFLNGLILYWLVSGTLP